MGAVSAHPGHLVRGTISTGPNVLMRSIASLSWL